MGTALLSLVAAVAVQAVPIDFEGQPFLADFGNTYADQGIVFKNFEDADPADGRDGIDRQSGVLFCPQRRTRGDSRTGRSRGRPWASRQ
ncbi:MAG: hypothetical protein CMO26_16220 [Thiotrichales bacterium]|nr:hypothetical protein [Thiotrichales bacterium]